MPKSKEEYERMRASTKDKILSAAIEVFAKKGYAATNTTDIAEVANVSVGLMYRHFRTKQELFEDIAHFALHGLNEVVKRLSDTDGNPKEVLLQICSELLAEFDNDEYIYLNMVMMQGILSEANPICKEILCCDKKMFKAAADLIHRGQEQGVFAGGDAAAKSALLFSAIQGMVLMRFLLKESFSPPLLSDITAFLF